MSGAKAKITRNVNVASAEPVDRPAEAASKSVEFIKVSLKEGSSSLLNFMGQR